MKREQKQTIKSMSDGELTKRLAEISKELVNSRMQLTTGALSNVHQLRTLRKEMALIKTIQSERK